MNPRSQLAVAAAGVTLLSSTALHAVFLDNGWVAPVVGVVLAVLLGAELGSRLGQHLVARTLWRFVGSVLGALFFVTAVFAPRGAVLGLIPRGTTWHQLRLLGDKGFDEVHNLPSPAPTFRALMYITVVGVAIVAIAVDQLSVRAPLIGLPLLALYSVPEWLSKDGTGWIPLVLAGAGYVGLLIREGRDRTSRWGRTVTGATTLGRDRSAAAAMSQAGWRIGAVAIAVAILVPPLVPDLGHFTLAKGGGTSSTTRLRYNAVANLGGDLQQSNPVHILSYRSSDGLGHYLRMTTLDKFEPGKIVSSTLSADPGIDPTNGVLSPYGLTATKGLPQVQTVIAVGAQLESPTLPMPVASTKLDGLQGAWAYQRSSETVFSSSDNDFNQSYQTTSDLIEPDPMTMDGIKLPQVGQADYDAVEPYASVPADLPQQIRDIAKARTKGATTEYQQAIALQNWFLSKDFRYSFNGPSGSGYAPVISFLTTDRQGYCQQFAANFVILARTLGIPARVGFGFTPGVEAADGSFSVDSHDAHEWPELYFEGLGWLRFEPTPRSDSQTQPPVYANGLTVAEIQALDSASNKSGATVKAPTGPAQAQRPSVPDARLGTAYLHHAAKGGSWFPVTGAVLATLIVVLVLLMLAAAAPLARSAGRRRRLRHQDDPREVALLAWRETLRDAYDLGYVASPADSPRQAAHRLAQQANLSHYSAPALDRLARGVERARYAPSAGDSAGLLDDAALVSAALFASVPRRTRWRARVLPRSTTQSVSAATSRLTTRLSRRVGRVTDRLAAASNRLVSRRAG